MLLHLRLQRLRQAESACDKLRVARMRVTANPLSPAIQAALRITPRSRASVKIGVAARIAESAKLTLEELSGTFGPTRWE